MMSTEKEGNNTNLTNVPSQRISGQHVTCQNYIFTVGVSIQFHIQVHQWCFVHEQPRVWELPGPDVSPLNSRSKTRQRTTLLLLTWIYFCRPGGTVNFTLPFMTNVTISIATSQLFRFWVAIFQSRLPMASLFRSLSICPGLLLV